LKNVGDVRHTKTGAANIDGRRFWLAAGVFRKAEPQHHTGKT
jgi:hypothetical protein